PPRRRPRGLPGPEHARGSPQARPPPHRDRPRPQYERDGARLLPGLRHVREAVVAMAGHAEEQAVERLALFRAERREELLPEAAEQEGRARAELEREADLRRLGRLDHRQKSSTLNRWFVLWLSLSTILEVTK